MTCKDCIHGEVCDVHGYVDADECACFKNKADFVKVVRCKDCAIPHNRWTGCPKLNGLIPPPDFYCSYGKRNDGGENNE